MKPPPDSPSQNSTSYTNWSVYIIRCADGSFYTGITTDPARRFRQHAEGRGAKFFRTRNPLEIAYLEEGHSRSTASKREIQIKALANRDKAALVRWAADQTFRPDTSTGKQD
jgi:putative endonuclease